MSRPVMSFAPRALTAQVRPAERIRWAGGFLVRHCGPDGRFTSAAAAAPAAAPHADSAGGGLAVWSGSAAASEPGAAAHARTLMAMAEYLEYERRWRRRAAAGFKRRALRTGRMCPPPPTRALPCLCYSYIYIYIYI